MPYFLGLLTALVFQLEACSNKGHKNTGVISCREYKFPKEEKKRRGKKYLLYLKDKGSWSKLGGGT